MTRWLGLVGLLLFAGGTLLLSEVHWFRRRRLVDRVAPYVAGGGTIRSHDGVSAVATWCELVDPLARAVGDRLARLFGVTEPLARRLVRVHSPLGVTEFRLRQLAWAGVGLATGTLLALVFGLPGALALGFVVGGPLLGFLVVEQQLVRASERWKRHLFLEMPVVAEQLALLVGAGYSLGAALSRVAQRGGGMCSRDLARVCERIRLGLGEAAALQEWAAIAAAPAVDRLVGVLSLNRQAGDLDRLVSEEARSIRRDVHRELVAAIERRSQQVWIPVTVATLVPGVIFLAVPFVETLRLFSNS